MIVDPAIWALRFVVSRTGGAPIGTAFGFADAGLKRVRAIRWARLGRELV